MSVWTHVTGAVRFDGIATTDRQRIYLLKELKKIIGNTCTYNSPPKDWDACTVPKGSEGSIQYLIHEYDKGLPWVIVPIWGDLRDYEDVQAIAGWFLKVCNNWPMVRQGIIEIKCEAKKERLVVQFNYEVGPKKAA